MRTTLLSWGKQFSDAEGLGRQLGRIFGVTPVSANHTCAFSNWPVDAEARCLSAL